LNVASASLRGTWVITVEGEVDLSSIARLQAHIDGAFAAGHVRLVIDLERVTFLDSKVLHTLFRALEQARRGGGDVAVVCIDPTICRVLQVFGLSRELEVCKSADAAALTLAGA
jgi:anti-anti-sigma factor